MKLLIRPIASAAMLLAVVGIWAEAAADEPATQFTEQAVLKRAPRPSRGRPDTSWQIHQLAFSPDGKVLFAVDGSNWTITLWDVASGKETVLENMRTRVLRFSPDGRTFATCGGRKIQIWDIASLKNTATLEGDFVDSIVFNPDGKRLIAFWKKGWLTEWDLEKKKELRDRQITSDHRTILHLCSSSKGPLLGFKQIGGRSPAFTLIDAFTDKKVFSCTGFHTQLFAIKWDQAEKLVAIADREMKVRLWDWDTGKNTAVFAHPPVRCTCLAFSPDSKILASGHRTGFCLYEIPSGKILAAEKERETAYLTFSPDGRLLATGNDMGFVTLWSVPPAWRKKK